MTTAAARPKRPARPTLAVGTAPLVEVGDAAAEEAREEALEMTDAADEVARDVVAGAVAVEMTDETDEATEEAMEETTEETGATADVVGWVAGDDVINTLVEVAAAEVEAAAEVGAAAEVEGCAPRQLESELLWTEIGDE